MNAYYFRPEKSNDERSEIQTFEAFNMADLEIDHDYYIEDQGSE